MIQWLERDESASCAIPLPPPENCEEKFTAVFAELARDLGRNLWMLLKPTPTLMLLASVVAAALIVLIPWDSLLTDVTPLKAAFISLLSVFMPVPIALDVMFPAQLLHQGVSGGYVMMSP